jgi:hypothetical protein
MHAPPSTETELRLPSGVDLPVLARKLFAALEDGVDRLVRNPTAKVSTDFRVYQFGRAVRSLRESRTTDLWKRVDATALAPTIYLAETRIRHRDRLGRDLLNGALLTISAPRESHSSARLRLVFRCEDPQFAASLHAAVNDVIDVRRDGADTISPRNESLRIRIADAPKRPLATVERTSTVSPAGGAVNWADKAADGGITLLATVLGAAIVRALGIG